MSWYRNSFCALDTETTGLDWFSDRVIQLGLSYFKNGEYAYGQSWIINSGKDSSPEAILTHGISNAQQRFEGKEPRAVYISLKHMIEGTNHLVIMNAPFDLNFLISEYLRLGIEPPKFPYIVDPLVIDRFYSKNRIPSLAKGRRNLKALSERYGIYDYPLHDAGYDSRRVGELSIIMAQRHGQLDRQPLSELYKRQKKWHREWSDEFAAFADAKGFMFTSAEWPHREVQWETGQLLLS